MVEPLLAVSPVVVSVAVLPVVVVLSLAELALDAELDEAFVSSVVSPVLLPPSVLSVVVSVLEDDA